jgi:predicted DNA-binding transcriptional regulator YafY
VTDTTTSRVLRLLSLLQSRRYWPGSELADRLEVSARTVRRDIDRLRELGYRVSAERGSAGGYLLEAGSALPPLLFTGDEAVALAVSLRAGAVDGSVRGMPDLTVAVLAKLEQVLPPALRLRVRAMQGAIARAKPVGDADPVDPEILAILALVCRDSEVVRFRYLSADGSTSMRRVEPIALVPERQHWYLLSWDTERSQWRTFRVDRISQPTRTHLNVAPRALPTTDAAAFVRQRLRVATPDFAATIRIAAPLTEVVALLGPFTSGLDDDGSQGTLWHISDDRLEVLAGALTWVPWPFEIVEGNELRAFLASFIQRFGG